MLSITNRTRRLICFRALPMALSLVMYFNSNGQVGISGPSSVSIGSSYTYYPTYNGSSTVSYNGYYYYTISGGVVTGTSNTSKGGTCTSILYSIGINVTWTSSTGSLYFSCSLGSASKSVTAVSALQAGTISPSSQTINYSTTPSTITGTAASGGAASPVYAYQWMSGSDGVNWTNISGATSTNYSPGSLTSTTYYRRQVTETTTSTIAYTNTAVVNVYPQLTGSVSPTTQTINYNTAASTLGCTASGGNGSYTYQWQSSPDNSNWTNGGNSSTYNPGVLTATKYYRAIVTSNGASVTSNTAIVNVTGQTSGTLAVSQVTPSGNGSVINFTCTPSGGNGTYSYVWYSSTNGGITYQSISGANSATYTTGVVTVSTQYYVQVSSGGYNGTTNIIQINMPAAPSISSNATLLCNGASATLTASGGSGSYKWYDSNGTLLGTNTTYITSVAGAFHAVSYNSYGISGNSNIITITAPGNPSVGSIIGLTHCVLGSTTQLASTNPGGTWSSGDTSILKIDNNGVVNGKKTGAAMITYSVTNACGTGTQQLGVGVVPFSSYSLGLGNGVDDPVITDTISLVQNTIKITQYQQDTLYSAAHNIKNVLALRVNEETSQYIPGDFNATAVIKIEYGHSSVNLNTIDSVKLSVSYTKGQGTKYNGLSYINLSGAEYTKITVVRVDAPSTVNGVSFDTRQVLLLTNSLAGTRYYQLADYKKPVLSYTNPTPGIIPDELMVSWVYPDHTGNNATQLEWTWLENEMAGAYMNGSSFDTTLLFKNNATRIDMPGGASAGSYGIPLLYGGTGKLFMRVRAVSILPGGGRSDGPWSGVQTYSFNGHNDSLNWQVTTTYAEEGKRKTVIQYYDGSLRARQTVTKDNSTLTTVVAETMYDVQGRAAIQILPAPGISNIIGYSKNLNKFNTQADSTDPIDYFDFTTASLGKYATTPMDTTRGTARYYSQSNPDYNTSFNKNIPAANGYSYAVTRYTPDATGRIMQQSGVGDSMRMGGNHTTKYYYGTAGQEELDALFGTEVGDYTHYFKNMVQDANGQMSVSYVDMHGRTIATALAGQSPAALQALNITDTTQYKNQAGKIMTRNLLDKGSNILKGNSIESINTILVPYSTLYTFNYQLPAQNLTLPKCSGGTVSYPCKFDLQISITDESGDTTSTVYSYPGIGSINFQQSLTLPAGSYSIRKTLTINQDSLAKFLQQYDTLTIGYCQSQTTLIDSIEAHDSTASGCGVTATPLTCSNCLATLGIYSTYLSNYAASLGYGSVNQLSASQLADIRNQYISDSSFCASLNNNTSHSLETIRQQMLTDMIPYSGQYAAESGSGTIYNKYNVFSPSGNGIYTQPFYRYPMSENSTIPLVRGTYNNGFGSPDTTVTDAKLATLSKDDFTNEFSNSWDKALLPYHPEYKKLLYAEVNLRPSFNFADSINQNNSTAFNPVASDPYFNYISTSDKNIIKRYSDTTWQGNYSMWQISYGDAFGCKLVMDTVTRRTCYNNMPKQFTATGTLVNTGSGSVTLSNSIQSQAWSMYKGYYTQVRSDMVNRYINLHTDTADNRAIVTQGYRIYFPFNNVQLAQSSGFSTWYPNDAGTLPTISLSDSVTLYGSHCDAYINSWRNTLLQCPALLAKDSASREQILNSITSKMLIVCQHGTDAANLYGSSTVAPAYAGTSYTSFEQVVFQVLDSAHISKDLYCHPYGIEFPKPYGKNPTITHQYVTTLDTCTCTQWSRLKTAIATAGYNIYSLTSINQYLSSRYQDTISTTLYNALLQCGQPYVYNCRDTVVYNCGKLQHDTCHYPICDTVYTLPLASPQPLPVFLSCGFSDSSYTCYTCSYFTNLESSFFNLFGHYPILTGDITVDSVIAWNNLFAKYVNFKSGLQHDWPYYAEKFNTYSCPVGSIKGTDTGLSICLDKTPLTDTTGLITPISPCQQSHNRAVETAAIIFNALQQQLLADFTTAYTAQCLSAAELFKVTDTVKEYHYTLYYYDQAGNLVKTVPPKGVNPVYRQTWLDSVETAKLNGTQLTPNHSLVTRYSYNSLNQVNIQKSPDGGTSRFWYDRLGRLTISQNAKQIGTGNVYSYTLYDSLGRITEVGQITGGSAMTDAIAKNAASLQNWLGSAANSRNQITQTIYDTAYGPIAGITLSQQNLRNRVSYTQVVNLATDSWPATATYYSYDIHGNVDTLLQDFGNSTGIANSMNQSGNRFKKIVYNYDLVSGKVNQVSYQPGNPDAYYHRYVYDAENRLTDVYSGRDSVILFLFPERDAHYVYYKHGPLARTELGQLRVQGLDYAYTLQGWIKGVNPAMAGTLTNGTDTTEPYPVAQDVYGFSLHYYKNDYRAVGYGPQSTSVLGALSSNAASLYNGNIAAMAVNIPQFGAAKVYNYHYDQLNRIVAMDVFNGLTPATGSFSPVNISDYRERVAYDPNGNILTYNRHGDAARLSMDSLSYFYTANTNRLHKVTDAATDAAPADYSKYNDLKQGQADNNYQYDAIGNMVKDNQEGITDISWSVYGKILSITKSGAVIRYVYDASGNRIMKQTATDTTIYVRDASGNVMSVYTKPSGGSLAQTEIHIYGSSRLGMTTQHSATDSSFTLSSDFGTAIRSTFTRGEKLFELSNHLGNVLVTISDRRVQVSAGGVTVDSYKADVLTANDYYPFGMAMPSRTYSAASSYRYGFNGKERDKDIDEGYLDFGARIYNSKLGRFFSKDPLSNNYPSLSPYSFAANNPIYLIDGKGKCPIIPWLIKGATGAVISAVMQFTINYIITENANEAFNNINWWQVAADGAQSLVPWNPPGGRWGKAAISSAVAVGANALNGDYNNLDGADAFKAVAKDFIVNYLASVGTHVAMEKLGKYMPKISKWLVEKGVDTKTIKKLTGMWASANSDLEAKVANYIDGIKNGTVEDLGRVTKTKMPNGGIFKQEIDIVTKHALIEVKEGTSINGKQLDNLIQAAKSEGKDAILFAPDINDKTVQSLTKQFPGLKVIKWWGELGKTAIPKKP